MDWSNHKEIALLEAGFFRTSSLRGIEASPKVLAQSNAIPGLGERNSNSDVQLFSKKFKPGEDC